MNPGELIRQARLERNWSQEELGRRAGGMNKETINRLELGANTTVETLSRAAAALDLRMADLFGGGVTSPVTEVRDRRDGADDVDEVFEDVSGYQRFSIPVIVEGDASPEGVFWSDEGVKLIEAEEWMSRPNDPAVKDPRCYGVKVRGDSMEPVLRPGMKVIVSPNLSVGDGDWGYVQLKNGERLIKFVHRHPAGYTLESLNRNYPPRFVARDEVEAIHRIAWLRILK